MPEDRNDDQAYKHAQKRVQELRDFYNHLAVYLSVNLGLFILNRVISPDTNWFIWPLIGWGTAILIHGVSLLFGGALSRRWEERKIRQLMEKERTRWPPQPPRPHAP